MIIKDKLIEKFEKGKKHNSGEALAMMFMDETACFISSSGGNSDIDVHKAERDNVLWLLNPTIWDKKPMWIVSERELNDFTNRRFVFIRESELNSYYNQPEKVDGVWRVSK